MASLDFDPVDYIDEIDTQDLIKELKQRNAKVPDGEISMLVSANLIDDFKIAAFKKAMEKYGLDEIEKRLE